MTTNNQNQTYKRSLPAEMQDFNWGAFLLTFVWGIRYKAWITLIAIPLILIHMPLGINWILLIIFQFYCGINGNKWAYQQEWWRNPSEFNKSQVKWAIFAISINIIIPFIFLSILSEFITKNSQNPKELLENGLCTISYNKLNSVIPNTIITKYTTPYEIAKNFGNKYKNTRVTGDTVIFNIKKKHEIFMPSLYSVTFFKPEEENCNLALNNCYISVSYVQAVETESLGECKYYFANGQIKPDEQTYKALQKGLNIFKYL